MSASIRPPIHTKERLLELGVRPSRKLGQNFLTDGNITEKSVAIAGVKPGDTAVEIGPGLGVLSEKLLAAGAEVYAVEIDKRLHQGLSERFAEEPHFHLMEGDAVKHPIAGLPDTISRYSIVANLPYAISTPWLESLLDRPNLPESVVIMLQKEAAERYAASAGSKQFGAVAVFVQAAFDPGIADTVSRKCFHPWPEVDSVLLHLKLKNNPYLYSPQTRRIIRDLFTQRRKQIGTICRKHKHSELLSRWLELIDNPLKSRPETLLQSAWQSLDSVIKKETLA